MQDGPWGFSMGPLGCGGHRGSLRLCLWAGSSPDPRLWECWFRLAHCFCVLVPLRLRQEKTDTVRCIKSCRPNDIPCALDPVNTISHTFVSLPTFREFTRPEGEW